MPVHLLYPKLDAHRNGLMPMSTASGPGEVARELATLIFKSGAEMPADLIGHMVAALLEAIALCVNGHAPEVESDGAPDHRFREVEDCVAANIAMADLSASTVAHMCNISTRYLSELMRRHGTSFPQFVLHRRLAIARDLLNQPPMSRRSISEIASLAGFKGLSQFARAFKAETGVTPSDYRRTG